MISINPLSLRKVLLYYNYYLIHWNWIGCKTEKFIQSSDDVSMFSNLASIVDENICLYRGFQFSNRTFSNEQDLTFVDLNSFCDDVEDEIEEFCFNFLRFTDNKNPSKLKTIGNDTIPTFQDKVECEWSNSFKTPL